MGKCLACPGRDFAPHRRTSARSAAHDSWRCGRDAPAHDSLQPCGSSPQPWPQDRSPHAAEPATNLGHAAGSAAGSGTGRAAVRLGRRFRARHHHRLHRNALGEAIGLEREHLRLSLINVEWQLHEVNGRFPRLPPKDDSYRSINWEPEVPVDLPPFLADLLSLGTSTLIDAEDVVAPSAMAVAPSTSSWGRRAAIIAAATTHGVSSGQRQMAATNLRKGQPGKLVIADSSQWPGRPIAAWAPAALIDFTPPSRGIRRLQDDTPLVCWLPVRRGLTPHGLRGRLDQASSVVSLY